MSTFSIQVIRFVVYDIVSDKLGLITVLPAGQSKYTIGSLSFGKKTLPLVISKRGKKSVDVEVINQTQDLNLVFVGDL